MTGAAVVPASKCGSGALTPNSDARLRIAYTCTVAPARNTSDKAWPHTIRVRPAMLSVVTEVTVRGAHSLLSECSTRSMSTNRIASPGFSPVAVPSSQSDVVTALQSTGFVVTAGMAFQAIRPVRGAPGSEKAGGWGGGGP